MDRGLFILSACCLAAGACNGQQHRISELVKENAELRTELRQREAALADLDRLNAKLKQQLAAGSQLGDKRLDKLFYVDRIEIGRLSGGRDFDGQIGDDGLTLYLHLYDQDGHKIKAAGDIEVLIYDVSQPSQLNLLAHHRYDVEQAKKLWYGRLMTYHYRLDCRWDQRRPSGRQIRVVTIFVDYLTGNPLQDVAELEVTPPLPATLEEGGEGVRPPGE